jgi:hypothetical protein
MRPAVLCQRIILRRNTWLNGYTASGVDIPTMALFDLAPLPVDESHFDVFSATCIH